MNAMKAVTVTAETAAPSSREGEATTSSSRTSAREGTVTLRLPMDVYEYFAGQAEADERTLSKFLERKLRDLHVRENTPQQPHMQTGTDYGAFVADLKLNHEKF